MNTIICPRCDPAKRSSGPLGRGGNTGYIWWDDATPEEQQAVPNGPDDDGEISCPLCEEEGEVDESRALDWAGVPQAPDAPPAKFQLKWVDDFTATLLSTSELGLLDIGILSFNGRRWEFLPRNGEGDEQPDSTTPIDCGPEEQEFAQQEVVILTENGPGQGARLSALHTSRLLWRDETRSIAALGAKIEARKWWPTYVATCTGVVVDDA